MRAAKIDMKRAPFKLVPNRLICWLLAVLFTGLTSSGCTRPHPPDMASLPRLPGGFSQSGKVKLDSNWWKQFKDPMLDRLVTEALERNLDIKGAFAALEKAKALERMERARLWPWLKLQGALSHSTEMSQGEYYNQNQISIGTTVSYEVDLWKRIRSGMAASHFDTLAQRLDWETMRISTAAQVANTYFEIIALDHEKQVIKEQIRRNEASLEIIKERYRLGYTDSLDLWQQEQVVQQTRTLLLVNRQAREIAINRLAVLLGKPPQEFRLKELASDLPALPPLPDTGVPVSLIRRRPDCIRAFMALKAANMRLAQAVSEQYPSLSLELDLSSSSTALHHLFEDWLLSLASTITAPIFQGGEIRARIKANQAQAHQALYAYGQVILNGLSEVEDALATELHQADVVKSIAERFALARKTCEQMRARYLAGNEEYLSFLSAQLGADELQRQLIQGKLALLKARIQLYKALAGPIPHNSAHQEPEGLSGKRSGQDKGTSR